MSEEKNTLIRQLCDKEWVMFDKVKNDGGRASCQNDAAFFKKMRACQFGSWSEELMLSYKDDLERAERDGRNLLEEKYAFMMEKTHPEAFREIEGHLPRVSEEALRLIAGIVHIQVDWEHKVDGTYPRMRSGGRPLTGDLDTPWQTSFETYLEGELKTYSIATLRLYYSYTKEVLDTGRNLAKEVAEYIARAYGYASLDAAEASFLSR